MGKRRGDNDFSDDVKRRLERRVACVCSKPGCGRVTAGPHTEPGKVTNVGNAGHITAAAEGGPRYDPSLTSQQRRSIDNGIWLCVVCHVIIDSDECPFSAQELRRWKHDAESRTRVSLELGKQRDDAARVISILHRSMELVPDGRSRCIAAAPAPARGQPRGDPRPA